ncbi:MAG: hypothetical protein L0H82_03835 [Lactobacillus sp.]|nr:hypothetical protein [Lactobacillus sp.]
MVPRIDALLDQVDLVGRFLFIQAKEKWRSIMKKWLKALAGGLVTTSAATMLAACSNSKADSRDLSYCETR